MKYARMKGKTPRSEGWSVRQYGIAAICAIASVVVVAWVWSNDPSYRASATLRITGKTVPPDSTVDPRDFAYGQFESMHDRVMASLPTGGQADIRVSDVETAAEDAEALRRISMDIAISVNDADPDVSESRRDQIAAAFLEDHDQQAASPPIPADEVDNTRLEVERAAQALEVLQQEVAEFEQVNAIALSGKNNLQDQFNQDLERQRSQLDRERRTLEARRNELDRGLYDMQRGADAFDPTGVRPLTSDTLVAVQGRLAVLRGRYGDDNPEAVALAGAIDEARAAADAKFDAVARELEDSRRMFEEQQRQKPIDHPDVVSLAHRVSALEVRVEDMRVTGLSTRDFNYIESLSRERMEIDGQIEDVRARLADVEAQEKDSASLAAQAPLIQQRYAALQQKVTDANERLESNRAEYSAIQETLRAAAEASPGEMTVVDTRDAARALFSWPATIALFFCLVSSALLVLLTGHIERSRRRVKGAELVSRLQGFPPLAEIPNFSLG